MNLQKQKQLTSSCQFIGSALILQFVLILGIQGLTLLIHLCAYLYLRDCCKVGELNLVSDYLKTAQMIAIGLIANILPFKCCEEKLQLSSKKLFNSQAIKGSHFFLWSFLCLGVNFMGGTIVEGVKWFLALGHLQFVSSNVNLSGSFGATLLMMLYMMVIAPITEEYIFRGVILNGLKPYGELFALLMSSCLFGLIHGNLEQGIPAVFIGMVLGSLALKTKSIYPSILVHMMNNIYVIALSKTNMILPGDGQNMNQAVGIITSVLVILALIYKKDDLLNWMKAQPKGSKKAAFKSCQMCLIIIIYVLYILGHIQKM